MSVRSFITLRQLTPRPWDIVAVFWARLLLWAKQKDVIVTDPAARVSETMHGTRVVFEPRFPWDHPLRVSVSGRSVNVRPGYVDDEMPTIEGIYLDGYDLDGTEKAEPIFEIAKGEGPGADGRSFICLRMKYDLARRQPMEDEPDWLTITHITLLDYSRDFAGPEVAIEPLAVLYWDTTRTKIVRTAQIVHHNLKHSFLPGQGDGTGKHFFSAV
jgi:hypothetical protein